MGFSDLPSPAEASFYVVGQCQGFAQAGNRDTLFGIMLYAMRVNTRILE
jgi:hypothetical protein